MAPGAQVNLPLSRPLQWTLYVLIGMCSRLRRVQEYMATARTVALLASDARDQIRFVVAVADRRNRLEICGMAFQTAWNNRAREIRKAVRIARTVDPADVSPVG